MLHDHNVTDKKVYCTRECAAFQTCAINLRICYMTILSAVVGPTNSVAVDSVHSLAFSLLTTPRQQSSES